MLILSRKENQSVIIVATDDIPKGTKIKVMLTKVTKQNVRIGFDADQRFNIIREELIPHKGENHGNNSN